MPHQPVRGARSPSAVSSPQAVTEPGREEQKSEVSNYPFVNNWGLTGFLRRNQLTALQGAGLHFPSPTLGQGSPDPCPGAPAQEEGHISHLPRLIQAWTIPQSGLTSKPETAEQAGQKPPAHPGGATSPAQPPPTHSPNHRQTQLPKAFPAPDVEENSTAQKGNPAMEKQRQQMEEEKCYLTELAPVFSLVIISIEEYAKNCSKAPIRHCSYFHLPGKIRSPCSGFYSLFPEKFAFFWASDLSLSGWVKKPHRFLHFRTQQSLSTLELALISRRSGYTAMLFPPKQC